MYIYLHVYDFKFYYDILYTVQSSLIYTVQLNGFSILSELCNDQYNLILNISSSPKETFNPFTVNSYLTFCSLILQSGSKFPSAV